jgi:hypothetical protein
MDQEPGSKQEGNLLFCRHFDQLPWNGTWQRKREMDREESFLHGIAFALVEKQEPKVMLTRREILIQLERVGVRGCSLLKRNCRDFENYMAIRYDFKIPHEEDPDFFPRKEERKPGKKKIPALFPERLRK